MKNKKIVEYKKQNELEIDKIVNEYSGYVSKVIINMANDRLSNEDIEEIITDTFFILWTNREKMEDERKLSSYIAGITKNLTKEKLRKINKEIKCTSYEAEIEGNEKIDLIVEEREKISAIENIVKGMSDIDIQIFEMYYYSAKKINEIAKVLNISIINAKTKLHRIRKKIKQELIKGGFNYEQ